MKGSCFCGTVQYEIDQLDGPIGHCHCRSCRKSHAATFASTAWVHRDHFSWLTGREQLSSFESSPGKQCHFCSVCGSHMVAEREGQPELILRVATLDDDPGVRPVVHIWTSYGVPWLRYGEDLPSFADWPPGH